MIYFMTYLITLFIILVQFLSCSPAVAATTKGVTLDRMVASVNEEAITASELNKQTELLLVRLRQSDTPLPTLSEIRKQVLEKMVTERLQLQLAKLEKVEVDEKSLNSTIEDLASRDNLTLDQMKKFIEEQGISFAEFRRTILTELILSKLQQREIGQKIQVSERDIHQLMRSPTALDQTDTEYHLRHILIALPENPSLDTQQKTESRTETILKDLRQGADFAKTAMAKSAGQQALEGGDLGFRKAAEMPSMFAKIIPSLRVGEIYGPIRDSSGFHIVKLEEKRNQNAKKIPEKELRAKATEYLYRRKFEEQLSTWLRELRADAEIKIYNINE